MMTLVRRCGTSLYWPSSTRFGSTRIIRTSSGVVRIRIEVTMALMHDDFPAPVAPAMMRWGSSSRCRSRDAPAMSLPRATARGSRSSATSGVERMSPSVTSCRCRLGTSMPIALLPGMGARMRTSGDASA